jgi:hypothetical protein
MCTFQRCRFAIPIRVLDGSARGCRRTTESTNLREPGYIIYEEITRMQ